MVVGMSEFNPLEWINMDLQESVDGIMSLCEPREECCERMSELTVSDKNVRIAYIGSGVPKRADMMSVVRCRDCKKYTDDEMEYFNYCDEFGQQVEPDGFCAWGKRREND